LRKILTVLGARPQFIKASVVSAQFARHTHCIETVVHTGQHFDGNMSDIFFAELGMAAPKYQLDIHGGSHGEMTGRMLIALEPIFLQEKPDIALVYGDTNSTLAGALVAAKLQIPIAHVEAGPRTFEMHMPEEINRVMTDHISRWLFTPTQISTQNLRNEGIAEDKIIQVGDVMYDVALHHGANVLETGGALQRLGLIAGNYALATIHRAENTNNRNRLTAIISALCDLARHDRVVLPLHPRTKYLLEKYGLMAQANHCLQVIEPVGYLDMVQLEKYAKLILTDSGGVQKEAFFHQTPCVTLNGTTPWGELVDAGWNHLADVLTPSAITQTATAALAVTKQDIQPYGDGTAAQKIVSKIVEYLA